MGRQEKDVRMGTNDMEQRDQIQKARRRKGRREREKKKKKRSNYWKRLEGRMKRNNKGMSRAGKDSERSRPYGSWIDEITCKK